jgi:hypothetical protein
MSTIVNSLFRHGLKSNFREKLIFSTYLVRLNKIKTQNASLPSIGVLIQQLLKRSSPLFSFEIEKVGKKMKKNARLRGSPC